MLHLPPSLIRQLWECSYFNNFYDICNKVAPHLYFLRQLKHAKVATNDLLSFYTTCIRPVAEYACPVFHTTLRQYLSIKKKYLSDQLERLQKRAVRIISTNDLSYRQAIEVFNIPTLYDRREAIGNLLFQGTSITTITSFIHYFCHLTLAPCEHGKITSSKSHILKQIVSETVLL